MKTIHLGLGLLSLGLILAAGPSVAEVAQHAQPSKYAGQEIREIKSLSPDDIAELRRGGGWGLAKAAELNGMPGPTHLLELRTEISLSPAQISAIEKIYTQMKSDAIAEAERYITLEKELELRFQAGDITDVELREMLREIAQSRGNLRFIHLSAHISTPELLTAEQIDRYNTLRGYDEDPCARIPDGHDPDMWRKHNGCD